MDTDPPGTPDTELKHLLLPILFHVRLFSLPCLFAGKVHAVLCRQWRSRVKGRDLYDFNWYLSQNIACDIDHLKARMVQSGHWDQRQPLNLEQLRLQLSERFAQIDFENAKNDVMPFLKHPSELDLWSKDFFLDLLPALKRRTTL